ncbi:MAG: 4-hydroxy-tetrahydrodipicolinate synthase [Bryobacterales bacterium]|nr:4-hydroxy-tetrahydrodipicolinate synthase [Bryobacterales bacterium]
MSEPMKGIVPALVTPFREDERVDYDAWQRIIEMLLGAGVHGLLVAGVQGEFFALDEEERQVAIRFCVQTAARRVPVYANAGAVTTRQTVRLAQRAEADGADYIVIVPPYYIRPSADELLGHYRDICRSVNVPVLVYNVPERTGVDFTPELARRLADAARNFVGLKDSSGNPERIEEYRAAGLKVFMGRDELILEGLERGCAGAISACANVAPRAFVDLYAAFEAGDRERAAELQALVAPLRRAFSLATFPSIVKEAMALAGIPAGRCRRPGGPPPPEALEELSAILGRLRSAGYLPPSGRPLAGGA